MNNKALMKIPDQVGDDIWGGVEAVATLGHLAFYTTLSALALSGVMPFG